MCCALEASAPRTWRRRGDLWPEVPWAGSWEAGEGPTLSLQVEGRCGPASGFPLAVFKLKLHEASVCRADRAAQVCRADRVAPCPLLTGRSSFSVEGGRATQTIGAVTGRDRVGDLGHCSAEEEA